MPTDETVEKALNLISRGSVQSAYFFDSLNDPDWVEPLRLHGFFDSPPDPVVTDEGTMHLPWPESRYLKRMASKNPAAVAKAVEGFEMTPNERVMIDMCSIGTNLDLASQLKVGKVMRKSLSGADGYFLLLPEAMAELAVSIAGNGDVDFARCFMGDLLELEVPETRGPLDPKVETRIRGGDYERVLGRVVSDLAPNDPLGTFNMLCDLLERGLEQDSDRAPEDYSHYWREDIGEDYTGVNEKAIQSLISSIRDLALSQKETSNIEVLQEIERNLRGRRWNIFRRLLFFIEAQPPITDMEVGRDLLFSFQFFEDPALIREYDLLAGRVFPELDEHDQSKIVEKISLGSGSPPSDDPTLDSRREEVWRRDRLFALAGSLPAPLEAELNELIDEYGTPRKSMFSRGGGWTGPDSPLDETQIAQMSAPDVVNFLGGWVPPEGSLRPSPEGLARHLKQAVADRPQEFSELASSIEALDPTYVRATIEGLETALTAGTTLDWNSVLILVERALTGPDLGTSPKERESEDRDPDWNWSKKASASFLQKAFESEVQIVTDPERTWKVLEGLSWNGEPTPAYEERFGGDNMDPLTLSLNTVRGQAMHAVCAAAVWSKRNGINDFTDLALSNLDQHLDPEKDPSDTTRGVFGAWLAALQNQFPTWFDAHVEKLFPADDLSLHLGSVTWSTFLAWNSPNKGLWSALRSEYRECIGNLSGSTEKSDGLRKSTGEALAEHLASYLWWGLLDLDEDPEIREFFAQAKTRDAIHLIHVLGSSLEADMNQPIDPSVAEAVVRLWTQLPTWIDSRSEEDRRTLLGSFGELYVADAISGSLGDAELMRLTMAGILPGPEHLVLPKIAQRVWLSPEAPLRYATAFAENPPTLWSIDAYKSELQMVIEGGIEAGGPHRAEAERLVNLLVSKGYTDFRGHIDPA